MDAVQRANSDTRAMPMGMATSPGAVGGLSAAQSGKSALARPRSLRASNGHGRCGCIRCCISQATRSPFEDIQHSASSAARPPATPSTTCPAASRPRPDRWARGLANAVGMRSRNGCSARSSTVRAQYRRSLHHAFCGDGCLMEGCPRGVLAGGHAGAGKLIVFLRRQRHCRSTGR